MVETSRRYNDQICYAHYTETQLVQDLNLLVLTITASIAEAYYGLTGKDEKQ